MLNPTIVTSNARNDRNRPDLVELILAAFGLHHEFAPSAFGNDDEQDHDRRTIGIKAKFRRREHTCCDEEDDELHDLGDDLRAQSRSTIADNGRQTQTKPSRQAEAAGRRRGRAIRPSARPLAPDERTAKSRRRCTVGLSPPPNIGWVSLRKTGYAVDKSCIVPIRNTILRQRRRSKKPSKLALNGRALPKFRFGPKTMVLIGSRPTEGSFVNSHETTCRTGHEGRRSRSCHNRAATLPGGGNWCFVGC